MKIGIQLYTVREALNEDYKGVLAKLAKLGFNGFEFAWNYGDMSPDELAAFLKELNVEACGMHAPIDGMLDENNDNYAYAKAIGCKYITTSLCGEVAKDWMGTIDKLGEAAKVAQKNGMTVTYHNHAQEFDKIDGKYALDILYDKLDASLVKAELDTYWIKKGGEDPVSYLTKYADRLPQIHLKDMDATDGSFTEIGEGLMDLPGIFEVGNKAGSEWIIYEQDVCKRAAVESAEISINNLKKAGLI